MIVRENVSVEISIDGVDDEELRQLVRLLSKRIWTKEEARFILIGLVPPGFEEAYYEAPDGNGNYRIVNKLSQPLRLNGYKLLPVPETHVLRTCRPSANFSSLIKALCSEIDNFVGEQATPLSPFQWIALANGNDATPPWLALVNRHWNLRKLLGDSGIQKFELNIDENLSLAKIKDSAGFRHIIFALYRYFKPEKFKRSIFTRIIKELLSERGFPENQINNWLSCLNGHADGKEPKKSVAELLGYEAKIRIPFDLDLTELSNEFQ